MGVAAGRWRREELGHWGRRGEVGALRWWGREVTSLLHLADFGLERQGQVGQVELAWFWGSRWSSWQVLGRGSTGGGGGGAGGRRRVVALGSKFAEQVPSGFLIGGRGIKLDAGVPLRGGRRSFSARAGGARG